MKLKFLKDQQWTVNGSLIRFKKDEVNNVHDEIIAKQMLEFGYAIKNDEDIIESKSMNDYEDKSIKNYDNKSNNKKRGRGRPKKEVKNG